MSGLYVMLPAQCNFFIGSIGLAEPPPDLPIGYKEQHTYSTMKYTERPPVICPQWTLSSVPLKKEKHPEGWR